MTVKELKNNHADLIKQVKKEHQLFLDELSELKKSQQQLLKKYRQKLEDLKIKELRKKLK
ncbi:MAG: hypothetical protein COU29_00725 [Candidatus Magasanikbacteria bacterium CG10_big_fil_rev_8_21_14_0_10_36_32]|uniref:Uncharacterized protein n=1 Tax=Candidatus Magasanikbacteria bacterium CG10_big_fil_rev_8_21_14_0_10_36_32 TaxID=1974646 RepID=A0A2M6W681_9BACT|nr:MAG: hypothetical protein COU29_00725 [Candidatus Magasanikbacteria bacterium CG10_big_fil_rev_8_21_14_0_10_36_32]